MRTLQTLRDSCIDTNDLKEFIVISGGQPVPYDNSLNAFTLYNHIDSGFYYLSGKITLNYDKTNFTFTGSKVHTKIILTYDRIDKGSDWHQIIDITNSYDTYGPHLTLIIERPVYVYENTGNFKMLTLAVEFDGTEDPVSTTGGTSNGVNESFNLVEWDDSFSWDDTVITNSYPGSGNIEAFVNPSKLFDFVIGAEKDGAEFSASVQFTAWLPNGFPNDSLPAGVFKQAVIDTCHIIIENSSGVEISRRSGAGSYRTNLDIAVVLNAGSYSMYVSGAGYTTISAGIEQHGYTPVLVSRTASGIKNTLNTDSALGVASLRVPVFKEINIDGTTTASATYLAQSVPAGIQNLPDVSLVSDQSHMSIRRIF
jgi:hypothetical protein